MPRMLTHPVRPTPFANVEGSNELYPVRRIFCVGRNYADHAREMGRDPDREAPFFFTKFADALVPSGQPICYPPETSNYQYEMELVVAMGSPAFRTTSVEAPAAIFGFACGLDMTRRDLQLEARDRGRPWDVGKSFEESAVMGPLRRLAECGSMLTGTIALQVNGDVKQSADIADLIWPVADVVAILSRFYRLGAGDLIFTGTPAGVGPVVPGDRLSGKIQGLMPVTTTILPCRE
jgi:fumarylpyruvate hydrolase